MAMIRVRFTANGTAFDLFLNFAGAATSGTVTGISGTVGAQTVTGLVNYNSSTQKFDGPGGVEDDVAFIANGVRYNFYGDGSFLLTSNDGTYSNTPTSVSVISSANVPEIAILGNAVTIVDGDTTPSATDHTVFGSQDVVSGAITRTFTIQNTGQGALSVGAITIGGANAGDFTVTALPSGSVSSGGSTTFTVSFDPSATGTRNATISVANNDDDENPYNFSVSGFGGGNTPPTVNNNLGLTLNEGATGTISAARLDFNDAEQADGQITYTVTSAATNGTLFRSGVTLGVGGTFTQADINNNLITYTHDSSETTSASFGFSVTDGTATVANQTFAFTVNPVTDVTTRVQFTSNGVAFDLVLTFALGNGSGTVSGISGTVNGQAVTGPVAYLTNTHTFDGAPYNAADDFSFAANGVNYNVYGNGGTLVLTTSGGAANVPVTGLSVSSAGAAEIAILGNAAEIVDGDATPSLTDHTAFGAQGVASGSITRTFTIQNTASDTLSVGAITIGGVNAGDFTVTTSPASSVAIGGSTTFSVTFDPSATGTRNATISVVNGDANENPYNFSISGIGGSNTPPTVNNNLGLTLNEGATATITAARLDFNDNEQADGAITYTVTSAATNGTLFRNGIALSVGGTFTQADIGSNLITYKHNSSETTSASFGFSVNDGAAIVSNQTFNFTVAPVADLITKLQFTAGGITFNLTLTYADGTGSGIVTGISGTANGQAVTGPVAYLTPTHTFDGAPYTDADDFSFTANGVSYNVYGNGTTLLITSNNGTFSNTPTSIPTASATTVAEIAIRGNAVEIVDGDTTPSAADHTVFGFQDVASGTITRTFTIENTGGDTLSVGGITIGGANAGDFTVTTSPASSVAPGGSTTFSVTFDPSAPGSRNATISVVNSDDGENPYNFSLSGSGTANTPPTVNANLGLTLPEGGTGPITAARLDFNDAEQADGAITYTVTSAATNGMLFRNGVALGVGGTFTQADLNSNLITYTHNSSETTSASFAFSVSDGTNTVAGQSFNFTVTPVNDAPGPIAIVGGGTLQAAEASANGTVIGSFTAPDPDLGQTVAFSLLDNAGGRFAVSAVGQLSVADGIGLDFEQATSHAITVRASDGVTSTDRTVSVTVTDVARENVVGDSRPNVIVAGGGNDAFRGQAGNDTFDGGAGEDTLVLGTTMAQGQIGGTPGVRVSYTPADDVDYLVGVELLRYTDGLKRIRETTESDLFGDASSDIVWRNQDGSGVIWDQDGGNIAGVASLGNPGPAWRIDGTGDFNGDGNGDLVWRNTADGSVAIWNLAGGQYMGGASLGVVGLEWQIRGTGDFDGDGDADLLWRRDGDGRVVSWTLQGSQYVGAVDYGAVGPEWTIAATGDLDRDGDSDVLWRNGQDGTILTWAMRPGQAPAVSVVAVLDLAWTIEDTGDFDADGDSDILFRNTDGGVAIWTLQDGQYAGSSYLALVDPAWTIQDSRDFTGDGTADILWRNQDGTVLLWGVENAQVTGLATVAQVTNDWQILG